MPLIKKPSYIGIDNFLTNYNIVLDLVQNRVDKKKSYTLADLFRVVRRDLNNTANNTLDIETSLNFLEDKLSSTLGDDNKNRYIFKLFGFLAKEHFDNSYGKIVLNIDNIDEFQSLINSIDMTPIYASAVDNYLSYYSESDKINYIREGINNTILNYPERFNFLSMVSDNHFHLGGALDITYRFDEILTNPFSISSEKKYPQGSYIRQIEDKTNIRVIAEVTSEFEKIIYTYFIKENPHSDSLNSHIDKMFKLLSTKLLFKNQYSKSKYNNINSKEEANRGFHFISFRDKVINKKIFNQKTYHNTLASEIYNIHQRGEYQKSDKLWWLLIINYLKKGDNQTVIDIIYLYIILRNILRKYIIQQHLKEGLSYFSSVSQSSIRRGKIDREYVDSFRSIFLPNFNVNIEGRINFQDSQDDLAQELHNWLESFMLVEYENSQKRIYKENSLQFMLHFQKRVDKNLDVKILENKSSYSCRYRDFRKDIFQKTEVFFKFLRASKYKRYNIRLLSVKNIQRLKKKFYDTDCLEKKKHLTPYEKRYLERLKNIKINSKSIINKKFCQNGFIEALEVDLTQYISGVDAASKEHTTPPEVFAPVYNYIRSSMEISKISFENRINSSKINENFKRFQFTFHAGEDFRDILTGMRRVVESVTFLGFKKGDRIGHALALGLQHSQWAKKKRRIFTTQEEQFDNAVFAYFILTLFSDQKELREQFYQKALHLGNEIYQENFTIDNYINAWLLRRNCPINLKSFLDRFIKKDNQDSNIDNLSSEQKKALSTLLGKDINLIDNKNRFYKVAGKRCAKSSIDAEEPKYRIDNLRHLTQSKLYFEKSIPDLFKSPENYNDDVSKRYQWASKDASAWEIYLRYQFDKGVKERGEINIDEMMRSSVDTEVLQDLILENIIAKKDIIIEAMPSSNVLNSFIEDYHKHPIFRFRPVESLDDFNKFGIRKTPIRVIINTDNPGFQATSYMNELFLIYNAGLKLGYSPENIEAYIKDIVELGNSIFENRASQE